MMAADHRMHSMQIQRPSRSFSPLLLQQLCCALLRELSLRKRGLFSLFCSVTAVVCSVKFSYISPSEGHTSNLAPLLF